MSDIKILSAKLLKGNEKLEVNFTRTAPVAGSDSFIGNNRPHPDLVKKFQALSVHLAVLGSYVKPKDISKAPLEKFVVTSYHYTIKDESEKVKIMGYILTERGASGINPPRVELLEGDDNDYALHKDLLAKLSDIDAEVVAYIIDGKKAPDPQQSLDFTDTDDKVTTMQITEPEEDDMDNQEDAGDGDFDIVQPAGGSKRRTKGLPQADAAAQKRVQEWEPGEYLQEMGEQPSVGESPAGKPAKKKASRKKSSNTKTK